MRSDVGMEGSTFRIADECLSSDWLVRLSRDGNRKYSCIIIIIINFFFGVFVVSVEQLKQTAAQSADAVEDTDFISAEE